MRTLCGAVILTMFGIVACSEKGPLPSSPASPSVSAHAKPGSQPIAISVVIDDLDALGNPTDIASDGEGGYVHGVQGVTSILIENGYNRLTNGDWKFNTQLSVSRRITYRFDPDDAIQPPDPLFIVAADPPYWGAEAIPASMQTKCTNLNKSMLAMTSGSVITCALLNHLVAGGTEYGLQTAVSFTGFPETTDVQITCTAAVADGCSGWLIEPIGASPAIGRLLRKVDGKAKGPNEHVGSFYLRFRIRLTRP